MNTIHHFSNQFFFKLFKYTQFEVYRFYRRRGQDGRQQLYSPGQQGIDEIEYDPLAHKHQ
jgi:hypothetical protein